MQKKMTVHIKNHQVVAAREMRGLDVNAAPVAGTSGRAAAKLKVFIVRYSYDPYNGPNHNPETELPLKAGEYICVYGDMDEDGFYEGELMDGRRGLVPSNFVELVSDDDVMGLPSALACDLSQSTEFPDNENCLRLCPDTSGTGDPPIPNKGALGRGQTLLTNGFDVDSEEMGVDLVPYPRRLTLIKQLAKSIIIGWEPPLVPAGWGNVWSYNVYVDKELRLNVPFGAQTKAVLERLDVNLKAYRVSVQSVTEKGDSDSLRCTFLVGRDVCMAPTQLRAEHVTSTSAHLTWLPSNSNYIHTVSLNDEECWLVKAGSYSLSLCDLKPCQLYRAKVEARSLYTPWELSLYGREHKSTVITFTTVVAGPPAAPMNVHLEVGPSPGIALISWLPVTVDAAGTSNGVTVTGYTIYADKKKVLEVSSPTAGSALMGPSQIHTLQTAQELTVRTMSPQGESTDSVPVPVLPNLMAITVGMTLTRPSGPAGHTTIPPLEISAAKLPTLLHNPPADSCMPPVETSCDPYKVTSTDHASILPPEVSLTLASVAVQTLDLATEPESLGMKIPTISVSEYLEHVVSSAELSTPSSPAPVLPQEEVPEVGPWDSADTQPHLPVLSNPPQPSPPEPETVTEDGSSQERAQVGSVDETSPLDQGHHTTKPEYTESQDNSYLKTPQNCGSTGLSETESDCCLTEAGAISDLSDLLEEDEGLYSDNTGAEIQEGADEDSKTDTWETDSDEEILERILRSQTSHSKELFSIPEVTEEEDNCQEPEEPVRIKSPQIQRLSIGQEKPAVTNTTHHSTMSISPTHSFTTTDSPTHHSEMPDGPSHCSKILDSPSLFSKIQDSPSHCSKILDSSSQCSKIPDSPAYHSKVPNGPAHSSTLLYTATHYSTITENPSYQSKIPDEPAHHSTAVIQKRSSCTTSGDRQLNTKLKGYEDPKLHQNIRTPGTERAYEDLSGYMTIPPPKSKSRHRVHYSNTVDTITYQREEYDSDSSVYIPSKREEYDSDSSVYIPSRETRRHRQKSHRPPHQRGGPERSGDRLRREAILRSQMASNRLSSGRYLGGKMVVRTRAPVGSGMEIDVEYGTEDDEEAPPYDPAGVVVEQMSSEWWLEDGRSEVVDKLRDCPGPDTTRPKKQRPLRVTFEDEVTELNPDSQSRRTSGSLRAGGSYSRERGHVGAEDLAIRRQTSPQRAKLDHRARSYSADSGCTRAELIDTEVNCNRTSSHSSGGSQPQRSTNDQQIAKDSKGGSKAAQSPFKAGPEGRAGPELSGSERCMEVMFAVNVYLYPDGVRIASPEFEEPLSPQWDDDARIFVALFTYDPTVMSPNPDTAEEELPFKEGQIIKVYGGKDRDGFYCGELGGRFGYVPCNMVSEIQVEDEVARAQLLKKGFLSPESSIDKKDPVKAVNGPQDTIPRRMVAIFDYDPRESSPNADIEAELSFCAGDIIHIFGDMDEDGFYYGDLNGQRGLVPSNFLQAHPALGDEGAGKATQEPEMPVMPESRRGSQRQRRKSVYAFNP
ncbi:hypothetical protein JZ751_002384 [Albula glossodonta]|uniref:RIMS-binding protein 2-like n=1 Tax=Albula glossodonta TaxID=121402 RepID=A0A8T2P7S9_9TELE|nr:hypothetical protein JZ751_002384 [Albula glossodonta]